MSQPKFPKSQTWQKAEIELYKRIFDLIGSLEKRIQQVEIKLKQISRES
jgi:hypothetical protein